MDGMEIDELDGYIRGNWESIKEQIRKRSYTPQPVRRVEIPKSNGSKRKLGIPTVMDRVIQQGIAQVISRCVNRCFQGTVMDSVRIEAVKWQSGKCSYS